MKTHFEHRARPKTQRLADLEKKTAELERKLSDARESLDHELAHYAQSWETAPDDGADDGEETLFDEPDDNGYDYGDGSPPPLDVAPVPVETGDNPGGHLYSPEARTATLINQGRPSAYQRGLPRGFKITAGAIAALALLIAIVFMMLPGPGPSWPASVARVQAEVAKACQNPDVSSEPGQVNFACGKATRQILWVFALLTSGNNPNVRRARHRPGGPGAHYARAGRRGRLVAEPAPSVQPDQPDRQPRGGGPGHQQHRRRRDRDRHLWQPGRPAGAREPRRELLAVHRIGQVTSHKGYPGLCARPVSSVAGQAALVADIYQRWVVGAGPKAAQNAAILFENAKNPGSPQVQAILKHLPNSGRLTHHRCHSAYPVRPRGPRRPAEERGEPMHAR